MKKIKLDIKKVLTLYESILINCSICGKQMMPLGDPPMEPYHYCWNCKIRIPFDIVGSGEKQESNKT